MHAEINSINRRERPMLDRVVKRAGAFEMRSPQGELSLHIQAFSHRVVSPYKERRISPALSNRQKLLRQLAGRAQLSAHSVKGIESSENRESLGAFTHLPTKLARPPVYLFHLRRRPPLHDLERQTQAKPYR